MDSLQGIITAMEDIYCFAKKKVATVKYSSLGDLFEESLYLLKLCIRQQVWSLFETQSIRLSVNLQTVELKLN